MLILLGSNAFAQGDIFEISGILKDKDTKETLVGATVSIKGTSVGTTTDNEGKFVLRSKVQFPFILIVDAIGFEKQEIEVKDGNAKINIELASQEITSDEVVVTASRLEESIQKSPVAIEKLDLKSIKASPAPTFYDALANVKGVQMTTSSITFKVPNTRGFNSPQNYRFTQLVDGVDMQSATLGVSLGNAIGPTELDIESVEITPGAASALYGMNAINGLANLQTKSPFTYQGLSVYNRTGLNHTNDNNHAPALMGEYAVRYAQAFNDKFAFKVNASYFQGIDWIANTQTDQNPQSASNPAFPQLAGSNNPASDGWNNYGDESNNAISVTANGQTYNVRRTGYNEKDLINPLVKNIKADGSLHYKITKDVEISYGYRFGLLDGVFQRGNKIQLNNATVQNHRIELKTKRLLAKAYMSIENTGNSYNLKPLADNLDLDHASNSAWTSSFQNQLQSDLNQGQTLTAAMTDARAVADNGRYLPGTYQFQNQKDAIVKINNWDHASNVYGAPAIGGAALLQRSNMYHGDAQYNLKGIVKFVDILVGADFREYQILPDGNNFVDFSKDPYNRNTAGGNDVYYGKVGGFVQATKNLLNDRLKLVGSLRYDKNFNFGPKLNPRAAVVYTIKENHNIRFSFQNGFRFPSLFEALSYVNNGGVRRVGGLPGVDAGLGYLENSYTVTSLTAFNNAVTADVNAGYNKGQAAVKEAGLLKVTNLQAMQPERINSFEVGYKSVVLNNKLVIDWDAYFNSYTGFLGQVDVAVPASGTVGTTQAALDMVSKSSQTTLYRVYTNSQNTYTSYGSALGINYNFFKKYTFNGNVSYNALSAGSVSSSTSDAFITGYNTPNWATNIGIGNREIFKNFGFNIVYRWQSAFNWQSPLVTSATVPSYNTFDAQVNYRVPKYKTTFKLGATNLLNTQYIQYAGGPTIGALYYASITVDAITFKKKEKSIEE